MTLELNTDGTFRSLTNHHEGHHWHPERSQKSVGYLLMWHANKTRHLARGYSILRYGPNPEHVGAHRKDTRTEVSR